MRQPQAKDEAVAIGPRRVRAMMGGAFSGLARARLLGVGFQLGPSGVEGTARSGAVRDWSDLEPNALDAIGL